MNHLLWTDQALADLVSIHDYIARDSPGYADVVIDRIFGGVERLADFPLSGRMVPELRNAEIREVVLGSYRIVHRTRGSATEILTVFHSSRPFDPSGLPGA